MPQEYFHSVTLDKTKCKGCTTCLKRCPTEAIRIRDNRARIMKERCIDCGECIRVCPYHAKIASTDPFQSIYRYKYNIALPAPTLYTQFKGVHDTRSIIMGLLGLGFDDVFEVARGAEVISHAIAQKMKEEGRQRPVISSACPAILRLIQVSFPALLDNVIDMLSPMDAAAKLAKDEFCKKHGVERRDVGVFFITPCPAKMTAIRAPLGQAKSEVDGAISILEIYGMLAARIKQHLTPEEMERASAIGVGWAAHGGETAAIGVENSLAVDGIHNVIHALEEIENGKLNDLEFFEGLACTGGCLGGPLVFENSFVAKNRMRKILQHVPKTVVHSDMFDTAVQDFAMTVPLLPNTSMQFDGTLVERMKRMEEMERISASLPGLDCGSCGSPSCQTLAEDIVRGYANEENCIFKLKERIQFLAEQMVQLSNSTRFDTSTPTGKKSSEA